LNQLPNFASNNNKKEEEEEEDTPSNIKLKARLRLY
jgi:hypothetical protein